MMSKRYILNKFGQKHSYDDLATLFNELDMNDRLSIIQSLGLENIVDVDGGLAPIYSADITSSEERFLNPNQASYNINLTGKLYNYFLDVSSEATSWKWTRNSGSSEDDTWVKNTKDITLTNADLTERVKTGKVYFTLEVIINDVTYKDTIDFSTLVTLNSVQIKQSAGIFVGNNPASITLTAEYSGIVPERFSWYVNDSLKASTRAYNLKNSDIAAGDMANIRLEVIDVKGNLHTDFISVPKISNGSRGEPGVEGPPGLDGISLYTWIRYADDELGTGMSEYPTRQDGSFREYMGTAVNKESPIESDNPADYTWARYIGEDGIAGANGFMWVVYSQYPKGINTAGKVEVHNDPYDEVAGEWMNYLGLAYNKEVQTEPNFNSMTQAQFEQQEFYWSKIKGEDGHTGYVFDLSNEMHSIPTDSEGKTHSSVAYDGAYTEVYLYYGNDVVSTNDYVVEVEASSGVVYTKTALTTLGSKFTITNVNSMADSGSIVFKAYDKQTPRNLLSTASLSLIKTKNAPAYKIKPSVASVRVQPGVGTAADVITPTQITVQVLKNTGASVEQTSEGILTYKYSYQTGDGTPIAIGSTLTVSNSGNPSHVQFMYFDPVNNMLSDIETIPFVRDGKQGDPGAPGLPGEPGKDGQPGPRGPFLAPRGKWSAKEKYIGNNNRIEAVLYNEKWYVTRNTAGNIPVGTLPTNTTYWQVSDETFEFIATNLLLAQTAYIENLGVRSLRTSDTGQRIEILQDTNSMAFYVDNKKLPAIELVSSGGNQSDMPSQEAPAIVVSGKVLNGSSSDKQSIVSNSGIFANGSNMYAISPSSGGAGSGSIVGLFQTDEDYYRDDVGMFSVRAGVIGINQSDTNRKGRNFGGYFNSILTDAQFETFKMVTANNSSITATTTVSRYINATTGGVVTLNLPVMNTQANGWNMVGSSHVGFIIKINMLNDSSDTKVVCTQGSLIYYDGKFSAEAFMRNKGTWELIWNGINWLVVEQYV